MKKEYRVTNEEMECDIDCDKYITCSDCRHEGSCMQGTAGIKDYAYDLLESRELIDKQTETIKEMREQLRAVASTSSKPTTKGELVYINNYIEIREILEKTKEYQ